MLRPAHTKWASRPQNILLYTACVYITGRCYNSFVRFKNFAFGSADPVAVGKYPALWKRLAWRNTQQRQWSEPFFSIIFYLLFYNVLHHSRHKWLYTYPLLGLLLFQLSENNFSMINTVLYTNLQWHASANLQQSFRYCFVCSLG